MSSENNPTPEQREMLVALEARFQCLATEWRKSRGVSSSISFMTSLPAYREIIHMGMPVVPFIMRELERQPDFWFAALREITKENPVPVESAGNLRDMAEAWLQWGRLNASLSAE